MDNARAFIVAVDFDGTLCEDKWPEIGCPNWDLIRYLKYLKGLNNKLILWTCRVDKELNEAIAWCKLHNLEFDAVNENLPDMIEKYGTNTRKIFADMYIDDKAIPVFGMSKYR